MPELPPAQTVSDCLAYGLARYMQSHFVAGTADVVHERLLQAEAWEIASILYPLKTVTIEACPPNWNGSGEEIDLAVVQTKAWAMVGEIKYFAGTSDAETGRGKLAQDIARVASAQASESTGLRLVILVSHSHGKDLLWGGSLFGRKGNDWLGLNDLILPDTVGASKIATVAALEAKAVDVQGRTPAVARMVGTINLTVTLMTVAEFTQNKQTGVVRVWSVEKQ